MPIRIRYVAQSRSSLAYSIERLADGLFFDFSDSTFKANPSAITAPLAEDPAPALGRYRATVTNTPRAQFSDGAYAITVHDLTSGEALGALGLTMALGDDMPVLPATSGVDPWSVGLPGSYAPGSAGHILGTRLDAAISSLSGSQSGSLTPAAIWSHPSRSLTDKAGFAPTAADVWSHATRSLTDKAGFALASAPPTVAEFWAHPSRSLTDKAGFAPTAADVWSHATRSLTDKAGFALASAPPTASAIAAAVWNEPRTGHALAGTFGSLLDASISSRSTYAGGPVASVTAPVTVGTVNDKSGYTLAPDGLDAIVVEAGINARKALSPILAAAAGQISGAGTGTIVIRAAGDSVTRITATTDDVGNRSAVTLNLPA